MAGGIQKKPLALIILDGWGIAPSWGGNAISQARTKVFYTLTQKFPSTTLRASGDAVGLPEKSPGNSEAGHLNIGAGRVVHQDIVLIDGQIDSGEFFDNPVLKESIEHAQKNNSHIHVMGLLSKTGVHSHIRHLSALLKYYKNNGASQVYIHLFSDGRDAPPLSGIEYVVEVEREIREIGIGQILTISGRFFSMDRDNRWGRISRAYNCMVRAEGNQFDSALSAFSKAYASGQTDEFIEPRLIVNKTQGIVPIADNDVIIHFNFRADRVREMAKAFLDEQIVEFPDRKKLNNLFFASFVIFDKHSLAKQVFHPESIDKPLAEYWADAGLKQFHIAETEKYPHVTYFLNGGTEKPYPNEYRQMIPSPKSVPTYDLRPQMSANEVKNYLLKIIDKDYFDCYAINFANADMVGHTGNLAATVMAVETVDRCLGEVVTKLLKHNGTAVIVADHGNAEQMVSPSTGQPDTEHTTNPVPFIIVTNDEKLRKVKLRSNGILGDVAATILEIQGIEQQMEGQSLIINEDI